MIKRLTMPMVALLMIFTFAIWMIICVIIYILNGNNMFFKYVDWCIYKFENYYK